MIYKDRRSDPIVRRGNVAHPKGGWAECGEPCVRVARVAGLAGAQGLYCAFERVDGNGEPVDVLAYGVSF
jgi:hypothetical protein